ncbi:MAG: DUF4129 domain-containing transglutaminase family protein [Planctomycetaceae bacterium]
MRADPPPADTRLGTRLLTLGLAVVATATLEATGLFIDGLRDALLFGAAVAGAAALVLVASIAVGRWPALGRTPRQRLAIVGIGTVAAFAVEIVIREVLAAPLPVEKLPLALFRDAVLLLALFSHHADAQRIGGVLATFLVIFASALAGHLWIQGLVVAFALVGVWWLMGSYWETLDGVLVASAHRGVPRTWLVALPALLLLVLLALPVAGRQLHALDGFMPTSGGQDRGDRRATSGVGDGDDLVAGLENIKSFAPIDDAPFMTSHEPALYDIFDDTYNEPQRVKKQERAISLPPQTPKARERHDAATSQRASREFSLVRKPGRPDRKAIADLASAAVFHVKGRVPLHLRLEAFDRYDGVEWYPEPEPDPSDGELIPRLTIETLHGRPWLRVESVVALDGYGTPETHAVKIVNLKSPRIPAPAHLLAVHVDKLAQADFYRWAQPGILRLDRDSVPSLTPIHVQSRPIDPRRRGSWSLLANAGPESYRQYGDDPESLAVRTLVASWVEGLPRGWPQIDRIVERIRTDYRLDPDARAPAEGGHAVADFLLRSRRGPDYLFASATVMALRGLGYPARLVSGFYARPERYDRRAGHTAVLAQDVHVWPELLAATGHWMTLEPTPGYEVLQPPLSWTERAAAAARAGLAAIARRPWLSAVALAAAVAAFLSRRRLADLLDALVFRLRPGTVGRTTVRSLVYRLDRRCRRAGVPRPPHVTPSRWLGELADTTGAGPGATADVLRLFEAALYAPAGTDIEPVRARALAAAADGYWSWDRLRATARRPRTATAPIIPSGRRR